jgi:PII-like signaling protein
MYTPKLAKKLIITVSESDRWHGRSVYRALLELFRHKGLSGATVTRGIAGFSGKGAIATLDHPDAPLPLPIRIEVIDAPAAIDRVLPDVYDIVETGTVEIQQTEMVRLSSQAAAENPSAVEKPMRLIGKAKLLTIHIGQDDKWEGEPLYEALVKRARQLDIAGASVFRGVEGYGAHKRIHKHHTLTLSNDDPIMITIVDTEEKINTLLSAVDDMVPGGCLIAISDVKVVRYEEHNEQSANSDKSNKSSEKKSGRAKSR